MKHSYIRQLGMLVGFLLVGSGLVALVGCSASGRSIAKNDYCPASYDPLTVDKLSEKASSKVELKPNEPLPIVASDYAYQSSEIYYHDPETGLQLHLQHSKNQNGQPNIRVVCARNLHLSPGMEPLIVEVPIVSDLLVTSSSEVKVKTKKYSFDVMWRPGHPPLDAHLVPVDDGFKSGHPQDPYLNYLEVSQNFLVMKDPAINRQLISHLKLVEQKSSGRESQIVIRALVNMKVVTPDERKKLDEEAAAAAKVLLP